MYDLTTFEDLLNATSSPASVGGATPSPSRAGLTISPCGPDRALASLSARQALEKGLMTRDTYGRIGDGSSISAGLQSSLESRLRAKMEGLGSPEYVLTWKHWDMPSGPPICALRASVRRTSGKGFTGWPTPTVNDSRGGANRTARRANPNSKHHDGLTLVDAVTLLGWTTPRASDTGRQIWNPSPGGGNAQLDRQAAHVLRSWATPRARDSKGNGVSIARAAKGVADSLDLQCKLVCLNGTAPHSSLSARMERGEIGRA